MNSNSGSDNKNLHEVILSGEAALSSLEEVEKKLNSASDWSLFDIIGGGFIASIVKNIKIENAQTLINDTRNKISIFQDKLGDIKIDLICDINISDNLFMFDVYFDNIFSDFMVNKKINEALDNIKKEKNAIEDILIQLRLSDFKK